MQFLSGHTYHIYNQGNNREQLFLEESDYLLFLKKMRSLKLHCSILAWCLMPNHFHWLIKVNDSYEAEFDMNSNSKRLNPMNKNIGSLLSSYTQLLNKKYGRMGSLFRKRTKAKSINEVSKKHNDYLLNCFLYIHQNPLRAGLANKLEDWEYSSFKDYCGLRNGVLCDKDLAKEMLHLPDSKKEFSMLSNQTIPEFYVQKLSKFS